MKVIAAVFMLAIITITVPPAFAQSSATVVNSEGSSVAGCQTTNECFIPHEVTIDVGGEVTWENVDTAAHTITSGALSEGGPDGIFDSSLVSPGISYSYVFDEAGEYPYFCLVHPWMEGLVIVKAASGVEPIMPDSPSAMSMLSDGTEVIVVVSEPIAGSPMDVRIEFMSSEHVNFDVTVTQGADTVYSGMMMHEHQGVSMFATDPLATDEPVDVEIVFQGFGIDELSGPMGETVVFAQLVPEFGTIAAMILGVAIVSIVAVSAKSKLSLVPRY